MSRNKRNDVKFFKYKNDNCYEFTGWTIIIQNNEDKLDWNNMNKKQVDAIIEYIIKKTYATEYNCPTYESYVKSNGDIHIRLTKEFCNKTIEEYEQIYFIHE